LRTRVRPSASLLLGTLYHSPNLAPIHGSLAVTYRTHAGGHVPS